MLARHVSSDRPFRCMRQLSAKLPATRSTTVPGARSATAGSKSVRRTSSSNCGQPLSNCGSIAVNSRTNDQQNDSLSIPPSEQNLNFSSISSVPIKHRCNFHHAPHVRWTQQFSRSQHSHRDRTVEGKMFITKFSKGNSLSQAGGPGMLGISSYQISLSRLRSRPILTRVSSLCNLEKSLDETVMQVLCDIQQRLPTELLRRHNTPAGVGSSRLYHTTSSLLVPEPSSQVEVTVNALKEKAELGRLKKEAELKTVSTVQSTTDTATPTAITTAVAATAEPTSPAVATEVQPPVATVVKKSLWLRVQEEAVHYYHGFRLLFIDTKICVTYCYRVLNGEKLSRREHRQLVRTTGDLFRLLPFSVFLIIPFMELLLPVAIKLFPGMLPSTFETANEKEAKIKKRLKVKLEMAKFLQETLDSMSLVSTGHKSESAKEFVLFFEKVRRTGEPVSNEEILKFSKLFADSITLDSLSRPQLTAICQLLEMQPFGTNNFLRFQIRMKLRSLIADDTLIAAEGVDSLSPWELQQACRSRGMRAYGMTDARLRSQLSQWLELSLDKKVPQSLLLLSRTLYLSDTVQETAATLAATISQLPEEVKTRTKAAIGKREGKIDNRTRLEVIQTEEKRIKEDKKDLEKELVSKKLEEEAKKKVELGIGEAEVVSLSAPHHPPTVEATVAEAVRLATAAQAARLQKEEVMVDKAPEVVDKAPVLDEEMKKDEVSQLSSQDLAEVEEALETIGANQRRLLIEEQDLSELKGEMQDYEEDIEDFKKVLEQVPERSDLHESKAARRLFSRVNRMIAQAEPVLMALNEKAKEMKKVVEAGEADKEDKATLVNLEELVTHLKQVTDAPDSAKLAVIRDTLTTMDTDNDGAIKLTHIMKALELLSEEQVGVPRAMFEEVIQSVCKEEKLQTMTVVQRAITTSKQEPVKGDNSLEAGTKKGDHQQQQQ